MNQSTAIDVLIYAYKEQLKNMEDKESPVYLTIEACKDFAIEVREKHAIISEELNESNK